MYYQAVGQRSRARPKLLSCPGKAVVVGGGFNGQTTIKAP
jgi:hypothetical protein